MSVRSILLSFASENGVSVDEAASCLHDEIDSVLGAYTRECEVYASACESVLAENPAITKEALVPMVAMALSKGSPASFPETLRSVGEFVSINYVGKRGRRKEGDTSARLTKRA